MSLSDISKDAGSVELFINDLANAFREKRWIRILSLAGVVFAVVLNPISVEYGLKSLGANKPHWYSYPIWLIITASFFVAAFLVALLTKRPEMAETTPVATSIIKGLLPYINTKEDAAWFAKLQRGSILQDCLRFCLGTSSSFAILTGESGTGKTSFLQAGLSPTIDGQGQRAVYVKLTGKPPLDSIRQSLKDDSEDPVGSDEQSLLNLLHKATHAEARPIVLILDQFEQFFTQQKNKVKRQPFIEQMAEWYKQSGSLPVKILISIRDDFADQLTEFQKEMDYTLTAHNKLRLEKFEPHEAAQVINTIAREAQIDMDEDFVRDLTKHELADREEGTVSAVDIQILSWMLDGQKTSEERAFNRKAFQRLGGVEGLLERFLARQLNARETEARKQAAIKVMLALTDQNVRAGALSLKALKEKLNGVISDSEIEEAVSWLARSDVRLITSVEENDVTLYELAHERIILPLRRLAFKEITDVDKAQQTLDRRVNEWIGNNRSRRYLLTFKEWRLIKRYWTLITFGSQKEQKEEFVSLSRRRFVIVGASFASILVLGIGGYSGYNWYERRPETQINNAQKRLQDLLGGNKDVEATKYAALLLSSLEHEKDQQLSDMLWGQISRLVPSAQASVLSSLAEAYAELSNLNKTLEGLDKVRQAAEKLDSSNQASVLSSLTKAYAKLSEPNETLDGLDKVRQATQKLNLQSTQKFNRPDQVTVLLSLATVYAALPNLDEASKGLDEIQRAADKLNPWERDWVLREVAYGYANLSKPDEGVRIFARQQQPTRGSFEERLGQIRVLRTLALAYGNLLSDPAEADKGLYKVQEVSKLTVWPEDQIYVLLGVAAAYAKLSKPDEALRILDKVQQSDTVDFDRILVEVVGVYDQLSKPDEALRILSKAEQAADRVDMPLHRTDQVSLLGALATAYGKLLSRPEEALKGLDKVQQVLGKVLIQHKLEMEKNGFAETIDHHAVAESLTTMVAAYAKLSNPDKAIEGLGSIRQLASELDDGYHAEVLVAVAAAYAELSNPDDVIQRLSSVQQVASKLRDPSDAKVLVAVAAAYARLSNPDEAVRGLEKVQEVAARLEPDSQRKVLTAVQEAYVKLSRPDQAVKSLQRAERAVDKLDARVLTAFAAAYGKLSKLDDELRILGQAREAATNMESLKAKSSTLVEIATMYAKLAKWREALATTQSIGSEVYTISALSRILIIWKDTKNGTKNMEALDKLFT